jgi:GntR family transcriptional regulator, transcriptional repressor for pyruvate dehydrogenase complex
MGSSPGWQPLARSRTYELVLDQIEEQILNGNLGVGDRLPPERDLATMLGVSRSAIREALRVLEAQGVLGRPQVGTGPESGNIIAGTPSIGLTRMLRLHVALANFPLTDVVEARTTLERASARLAATHATPEQLANIRQPLDQMDDPQLTREEFNELDTAYHVAIAEAAGNRLVSDMTIAMRNAMRHTLLEIFANLVDWPATAARLRREHRSVYEALSAGNPTAAADAVEAHIRDFYAPSVVLNEKR